MRQAIDLNDPIDDVNHKIVRWRLFFPALGHFLHLPAWFLLGLSHVGAFFLILSLVNLGWSFSADHHHRLLAGFCFAIIVGATAPFITSMGLLGYYDSWLALGLVTIAFSRSRALVLLACLATPWVDERLVIGFPLSLGIRFVTGLGYGAASFRKWFHKEALGPCTIVAIYTVLRLHLGGSQGSQTMHQYFQKFIAGEDVSLFHRFVGAVAGLRIAVFLVLFALIAAWPTASTQETKRHWLPLILLPPTFALALLTAVDLSRSMVILLVIVPLGWAWLDQLPSTGRVWLPPIAAITALILPAYHVVGTKTSLADNWFKSSAVLMEGVNATGIGYLTGAGVVQDQEKGFSFILKAANQGWGVAQKNAAVLFDQGVGTKKNESEALRWFRLAAESGSAEAQGILGERCMGGTGLLPLDEVQAIHWFEQAAAQDHVTAMVNLGKIYARGNKTPIDRERAHYWWNRAAGRGNEEARQLLLIF